MLSIQESLNKLHSSKEFKDYEEQNNNSYLCACFLIFGPEEQGTWQLDYYNKEKHEITSFILSEKIEVKTSEEIFQKEKKDVEELDLKKLKISFEKVLEITEKLRKEKYKHETPTKTIVILQNAKPLWNITYLTASFKILNVKINAITGEIIEERLESVMGFKR